jgi:4-hydroxy-tetrahydrodipicolinate synthase
MIDEPENRWAIHESLDDVNRVLGIAQLTMTVKAALKMLGHDTGGVRLPLVECDEDEVTAIHDMLSRRGLLSAV